MYYFIISIYVTIETRITLLDNSRHFPCKNIYVDNLHNVHSVFSRSNDNLPKKVYMKKSPHHPLCIEENHSQWGNAKKRFA